MLSRGRNKTVTVTKNNGVSRDEFSDKRPVCFEHTNCAYRKVIDVHAQFASMYT